MKKINLLSLLSMALFMCSSVVFVSCHDDEKDNPVAPVVPTPEATTLSLSKSSITLNSICMGGNGDVKITSNSKWTVTSNSDWLSYMPTNSPDVIIIYAKSDNTSFESRKGIITVTAGSVSKDIAVEQAGKKLVAEAGTHSITYNSDGTAKSYIDLEDREFIGSNNGTTFTNTCEEDGVTTTTTYKLTLDSNRRISKATVTFNDKEGSDYDNETHNLTFEYNKVNNLIKITDVWTEKSKIDGDIETDGDTEVITYDYEITELDDPSCSLDYYGTIKSENHTWFNGSKNLKCTYTIESRDPWNYYKVYLPCFMNLSFNGGNSYNPMIELEPFAMMGLLGDFSIEIPTSYTSGTSKKSITTIEYDQTTYYISKCGNITIKYWPM